MIDTYHSSIRHDIIPLVPRCGRLLDVGGGTGANARHLRRIGVAREVGVIDAVLADGADGADPLDFQSAADLDDHAGIADVLAAHGPFDAILLLDVLEHLVDPWAAAALFARHVAPGGMMVASIPNIRHIKVVADLVLRDAWTYREAGTLDRTHLRFFVRETAVDLLRQPGFAITRVEPSPIGSGKHRLANALSLGLLRSFFTLQYFIVARRHG